MQHGVSILNHGNISRDHGDHSYTMAFSRMRGTLKSNRKSGGSNSDSSSSSDDDDNFEEGSNRLDPKSSEVEMEVVGDNEAQMERIFATEYANFNEQFKQMSVKQRTSYFIINTVLMSICHCLIH